MRITVGGTIMGRLIITVRCMVRTNTVKGTVMGMASVRV